MNEYVGNLEFLVPEDGTHANSQTFSRGISCHVTCPSLSDLFEAALRLEEGQRVQLAAIFARHRDAWAEVGEDGLATWFGEVVALLGEARSEAGRRARDLEIEFARVLGVEAGPGGIVVASRDEAGYPPDSAGRQSAHDARGYPVLSDDAHQSPEES